MSKPSRFFAIYGLVSALGIAVFIALLQFGSKTFPSATLALPESGVPHSLLPRLLFALTIILVVTKSCAYLMKRFHQPPVIGEVLGGIALGPTIFGALFPEVQAFIFPKLLNPSIDALAQVGIILFMFIVGLEFDTRKLKNKVASSIIISHASIFVPLLLGLGMSFYIYPRFASPNLPFPLFALFVGVSISVTAFPVLARIIKDLGIQNSPMAVVTMGCAAVDDVSAWCLLALITCVAGKDLSLAWQMVAMTFAFAALMIVIVRPIAAKLCDHVEQHGFKVETFTAIIFMLLLAALATEAIGIHALFGAFFLGVLIPTESAFARKLTMRLETLTTTLFLPLFFVYSGLKTDLSLLAHGEGLSLAALITGVAIIGKVGASGLSAYCTGIDKRDSLALGLLMNTRGLVELVVLNLGLELGLLTPLLFSAFIVMTLVTTLMTTPLFILVTKKRPWLEAEKN
ncbi:MAG: cation:proton antiporter [Chitinophagaceae bacterium]|nr:cation:proton antiporter [Oligoflexus sp.]